MEFIYISSYRAVFSLFLIRKKILKLINPQTLQQKTLVTMVANTRNDTIGPSVLMNHSMITRGLLNNPDVRLPFHVKIWRGRLFNFRINQNWK